MKSDFGFWTIAPATIAKFQYRAGEESWNSEISADINAAWTVA